MLWYRAPFILFLKKKRRERKDSRSFCSLKKMHTSSALWRTNFWGGAELQSFGERDEWREKELKKEGRKEEPQKYESWKRKAQK